MISTRGALRRSNPIYRIGPAFVLVGVCTALVFSSLAEIDRANAVTESDLRLRMPELASIFIRKDWLGLSKIGRSFATPPVESLIFKQGDQAVFSYPLETEEPGCRLLGSHVLEQYGAVFGALDVCLNPLLVLRAAVLSPLFMLTALGLFFIIGMAALLPVMTHRRGLAVLVDYLSEWSVSAEAKGVLDSSIDGSLRPKLGSLEDKLHNLVSDLARRRVEIERKAIRDEIVRDVAHNFGSPIATMAIRIENIVELSPASRSSLTADLGELSSIVNRLRAAARLPHASEYGPATPALEVASAGTAVVTSAISDKPGLAVAQVEKISAVLEGVVSDKRLEKSERPDIRLHCPIRPEAYGAFVAIQLSEFRAVVSNLLNNAYDAIDGAGEISIRTQVADQRVRVTIEDSGCGIPDSVQAKLFAEGFSYCKKGGTGRGLFHARRTLAALKGHISIESVAGHGTKVTIDLPLAPAPSWFVPRVDLTDIRRVAILDDDPSMGRLWRDRLPNIETVIFTEPAAFLAWLSTERMAGNVQTEETLFLVDLQLGPSLPTGLDIIESEGLADSAILVTSDAFQERVRGRCGFLGAKLLWKAEVGVVPITLTSPQGAVLDEILHANT